MKPNTKPATVSQSPAGTNGRGFDVRYNGSLRGSFPGQERAQALADELNGTKPPTKHTPGPWAIAESVITDSATVCISKGDGIVSHVARLHDKWLCPEHGGSVEANARLIAAAPDLLEAAKDAEQALADIINAADNGEPYSAEELAKEFGKYNAALHAAIAKAEGR